MWKEEGYFFISENNKVLIYRYKLGPINFDTYRMLEMELIRREKISLEYTYESIKESLINDNPELPNPAVYLIYSTGEFPISETILPIGKRKLWKVIAS